MPVYVQLILLGSFVALISLALFLGRDKRDPRKRAAGGGGPFLVLDELFAPSRVEAAAELDRQTILPAPAPLAGDDDFGVGGTVIPVASASSLPSFLASPEEGEI